MIGRMRLRLLRLIMMRISIQVQPLVYSVQQLMEPAVDDQVSGCW